MICMTRFVPFGVSAPADGAGDGDAGAAAVLAEVDMARNTPGSRRRDMETMQTIVASSVEHRGVKWRLDGDYWISAVDTDDARACGR